MSLKEETSIAKQNNMINSLGIPSNTIVNRVVTAAAANIKRISTQSERTSKHYSVSIFYSMATEQDIEIEDELAKGTN
jgi:Ras GTPase-activating-like protein IQGAP2/3